MIGTVWGVVRPWLGRAMWVLAGLAVAILGVAVPLPLGPVVVTMRGSDTIGAELAPDLVLGFLGDQVAGADVAVGGTGPDVRVGARPQETTRRPLQFDISSGGSDTGFECDTDIGMSSRPATEQERDACDEDLRETLMASDAVAVVTHPGLGLTEIQTADLRAVYRCQITDWQQLGLPAGSITAFRRDDDSGTTDVFQDRVLGGDGFCGDVDVVDDSVQLSEQVAQTDGAIGFVGLPFVGDNTVLAIADAPGAAAVPPTEDNVRNGTYPLGRDLYLYTRGAVTPLVDRFLTYVRDCDGQQRVADAGFFRGPYLACEEPERETPQDLPPSACPPGSPEDYCAFVAGATQLPFAVRFDLASGQVDDGGRQDLTQLDTYLDGLGPDVEVLLAGFTDSAGDPAANEDLSRDRANEVAGELAALDRQGSVVAGFGERFLVAAETGQDGRPDEAGRERNRRVEVWIRATPAG